MTGDVAKAITLASFGTAFLKDGYDISTLNLEHPSFRFTHKVAFLISKNRWFFKPKWVPYAASPVEWLERLNREGCKEVRMVYKPDNSTSLGDATVPDYKLAGFVGGGQRFFSTVFEKHTDYWIAREEVTYPDAPDDKIWTVSYGRVLTKQPPSPKEQVDIQAIRNTLKETLTEISNFSKAEGLTLWAQLFEQALSYLNAPEPYESDFDRMLVPLDKIGLLERQVLAASGKAWVFGGMGSWNDLWFERSEALERYEKLSAQLYAILNHSYTAVANSYR